MRRSYRAVLKPRPIIRGVIGVRRGIHLEVGGGSLIPAPLDEAPLVQLNIDLDIDALSEAAQRSDGWAFACGDAMTLPLRDACCESVMLSMVLHHLAPTTGALAELARTVMVGGRCTIIDGEALPSEEASQMNRELVDAGLSPEPLPGFDLDQLRSLMKRTGFEVTEVQTNGIATFATPPFVSRRYSSDRFTLTAIRR